MRQAFTDLLSEIKADPTWRLIVTCRDYSAETVRTAFFGHAALAGDLFAVPLLSDEELTELARLMPALQVPLGNPRLVPLLRNLFVLDKAAQLNWQHGPVPGDEREFRARVWSELIRRDDQTADAMPTRARKSS